MPIIKAKPDDIIRDNDIRKMIMALGKAADKGGPLVYQWKDKDGQTQKQNLWIDYYAIACMIAILYLFGKRISEIITLRRKDIWEKRGYVYVRFGVLEKSKEKENKVHC